MALTYVVLKCTSFAWSRSLILAASPDCFTGFSCKEGFFPDGGWRKKKNEEGGFTRDIRRPTPPDDLVKIKDTAQ